MLQTIPHIGGHTSSCLYPVYRDTDSLIVKAANSFTKSFCRRSSKNSDWSSFKKQMMLLFSDHHAAGQKIVLVSHIHIAHVHVLFLSELSFEMNVPILVHHWRNASGIVVRFKQRWNFFTPSWIQTSCYKYEDASHNIDSPLLCGCFSDFAPSLQGGGLVGLGSASAFSWASIAFALCSSFKATVSFSWMALLKIQISSVMAFGRYW